MRRAVPLFLHMRTGRGPPRGNFVRHGGMGLLALPRAHVGFSDPAAVRIISDNRAVNPL
jgi:hypothetical protein